MHRFVVLALAAFVSAPPAARATDQWQRLSNDIGYDGWYVFETQHKDRRQMLEATGRNARFLEQHCTMPVAGN